MRNTVRTIISMLVVSVFLLTALTPVSMGDADDDANDYVCELTCAGKTTQYATVTEAVAEWDKNGTGDCSIKIYETKTYITEDPIHIEQKTNYEDRTLTIEGVGKVVMKCSDKAISATDKFRSVFYITAQSDFTQTPSLTFRNITFDLTGLSESSYGIYSCGTDENRYIGGIFVDTCRFIGDTSTSGKDCVAVGTRNNGSADITIYNCLGEDLHTLFNGYCFIKYNETYGLNIIGCTLTNGKYFVNNQAGEHSTYIADCIVDYYGDQTKMEDSYGVRTKGSSLYMDNVTMTYTGKVYAKYYDAFVVIKSDKNNAKVVSINNCSFNGFDDVTTSFDQNNNRKDVYMDGLATIEKLTINGEDKQLIPGSTDKYYNFPRYTVKVDPATGGSATVSDGHYDKTSLKAMKGAKLTLTRSVENHYVFEGWDVSSDLKIDSVDQFIMTDSDITITPTLRHVTGNTYKVNVEIVGGEGSATPTNYVESGSDFILMTKANENYKLSKVVVNGEDKGPVAMLTISNITKDVTIKITFKSSPGTITEISDDGKFVIETDQTIIDTSGVNGMKEVSKVTDADSEVINQISISNLILDVVTTATQTDSERYAELNNTIQSKITVGSTVTEKIAEVKASQEYIEVANKQIEWIQNETGIGTDPIYMMNIHSDDQYKKISAEFGKVIVDQINNNNGLLAISSGDEGMSGKSSVVLDRDVVNGLIDTGFSTLNLTVGLSEVEELTPEQQAVVGDNTVVFAKLILTDQDGNKTEVSKLGGTAKISIEHEFESENPEFYIYYVTPDGELQLMKDATYDPYTKTISFVTNHFSQFVIMEEHIEPTVKEIPLDWIVIFIAGIITFSTIVSLANYEHRQRH